MRITARAKINWSLDIVGVREDGYHLMDMLMQPVSLSDELTLHQGSDLTLTCDGFPRVSPRPDNLILRAARLLRDATGVDAGAGIHLHKRIPVGAGMGGGSADAAGVLVGLNKMWCTGLSVDELAALGLTLGADVPFCLRGGLRRVTGIGESMTALPCARHYWLVVLQPCAGLSTKAVFTAYHQSGDHPRPDTDAAARALTDGDLKLLCASLQNVLQPVSQAMRPEIAQGIARLKECGALGAWMTGSGSAVFGVFASAPHARRAENRLRRLYRSCFMCHTCEESILVDE